MAITFNNIIQTELIQTNIVNTLPFVNACALFFYKSKSNYKFITRSLKYNANIGVGKYFANMLGGFMCGAKWLNSADIVIPVPLHKSRLRQRGFNQAQIIAKEIALKIGVRLVDNLIIRTKKTQSQTKLNSIMRKSNVANAFVIKEVVLKSLLQNNIKHIIIVDDVFTTGVTMYECYKVLILALLKAKCNIFNIKITIISIGYVGY